MTDHGPAPTLNESGTGYPVLLVHSLGFDSRQWNPQVAEFAEHYRVLRVEWNYTKRQVSGSWAEHFTSQKSDFGTGKVPEQRVVDPAGDLLALMDHAGIPDAHLLVSGDAFGDSMVVMAVEHPERVRSLTVATWNSGVSTPWTDPEYLDTQMMWAREYEELFAHGDIERYVAFLIEHGEFRLSQGPRRHLSREMLLDNISYWSPPLVMTKQSFLASKQTGKDPGEQIREFYERIFEGLDQVRTPMLAVIGQQAMAWRKQCSQYLASRVPGAREAVIPDARLYPNLDNPGRFNEQVLSFLQNVDARTAT